MGDKDEAQEILIAVVEGRRDWTALRDLGYSIEFDQRGFRFDHPADAVEIDPTLRQVASGFVAAVARDDLARWAAVLTGGPFGFDEFSDTPDGERLKELLWDGSFGETPNPADVAFVASLAERS